MIMTQLKRRRIFKFILKFIFIVFLISLIIFLISNKFRLVNTWYYINDFEVYKYEFNKDETFTKTLLNSDNKSDGKYVYDKEKNKLSLTEEVLNDGILVTINEEYKITNSNGKSFKLCNKDNKCTKLYKNKDNLRVKDDVCKKRNKTGFCIENESLIAYAGTDINVKIPSNIETISSYSFNKYYSRGEFIKEITVPENIKKIDNNAFAFSVVDSIYIEEGVEVIGDYAFNDTCLSIIDFPKSIKEVGTNIFVADGKCHNTIKIYLYKDSVMDKYLKKIKPYYDDYKFIYK